MELQVYTLWQTHLWNLAITFLWDKSTPDWELSSLWRMDCSGNKYWEHITDEYAIWMWYIQADQVNYEENGIYEGEMP